MQSISKIRIKRKLYEKDSYVVEVEPNAAAALILDFKGCQND